MYVAFFSQIHIILPSVLFDEAEDVIYGTLFQLDMFQSILAPVFGFKSCKLNRTIACTMAYGALYD